MPSDLSIQTAAPADQREFMAHFPTGVAVVTTVDSDGTPYGATCSSLTSVCLTPPTVLVSLARHSQTLQHALAGGGFAVNLLDGAAEQVAARFAVPRVDHFQEQEWSASPAGLPWLDKHMTAAADCDVLRSVGVGDHCLLLGVVRQLRVVGGPPLMYGLREYRQWQPRS